MIQPAGRFGRLESDARILALAKLANVGSSMLWGFVVTFVFVRVLPLAEFRAFLLLVAFANFTVSADFGFSTIIYARLRRFRLGSEGGGEFRPADVAMLFAFMGLVVALGALAIGAGLASGHIPTSRPGLFMAFYLLSAANIFALLAKRALAALDRNLLWEGIDMIRRGLSIALLLVVLAGMPILLSVLVQIALTVVALLIGLGVVHRDAGMRASDWLLRGVGWRSAGQDYVRDMGATMLLTLSDVAAYNAPYFAIAVATRDPRPVLVFDFVFKISRALTAVIRALSEAMLPRLTRMVHAGQAATARGNLARLRWLALLGAGALGLLLIGIGPWLSNRLFDGKATLTHGELLLLAMLLLGLAMLCVSTFVHNGLGRFGVLLPLSLLFLTLSIGSVPAGAAIAASTGVPFALAFVGCYAAAHLLCALGHVGLMQRLARA